jgi:hypothetical protein
MGRQPLQGSSRILGMIMGLTSFDLPLHIHLFVAGPTIDDDVTAADLLAVECDFSGYAPADLSSWTGPTLNGGRYESTPDPTTFTHDGGATSNDVVGYFITDEDDLYCLWVEEDPSGPITMANVGDAYIVTPTVFQRNAV